MIAIAIINVKITADCLGNGGSVSLVDLWICCVFDDTYINIE